MPDPSPTTPSPDSPSPTRPRRLARRLARAFVGLLAVLIIFLLVSMITDRMLPDLGVRVDRPTRLTLPPNVNKHVDDLEFAYDIATDALGLRSTPTGSAMLRPTRRIVVIGSAQAFGVGVDAPQTFSALLARRTSADVVNAAVPSANLLRQARVFRHVAVPLQPDLVLLCISANDLADAPTDEIADVFALPALPRPLTARLWPNASSILEARRQRDRFLERPEPDNFVKRIESIARRKGMPDSDIVSWKRTVAQFPELVRAAGDCRLDGNTLAFGLLWPSYWQDALDLNSWRYDTAWRNIRQILAAIRDEVRFRRIRLAVAFIPARIQYSADYLDWQRELGYRVDELWLREPSRFEVALGRWCGDRRIPFISLLDAFRAYEATPRLSHRYSGLLTPEGHRLVADCLIPLVEK